MNIENIRKDFPILKTNRNGYNLIYLDNASTTQKPQTVIDAISSFYTYEYSSINRGLYYLSEQATQAYDEGRKIIADFINAQSNEIVFTSGSTESINFIVDTWGNNNINKGDEIILSEAEHHSNLLPWIRLAQKCEAIIRYIPITTEGELDYAKYKEMLNGKTKIVAISSISNVLGIKNNLDYIITYAKNNNSNIKVLVDAAQSVAHTHIDIKKLKADFLVFSAHKVLGPTGLGILYIKKELHNIIEPYKLGGSMVLDVSNIANVYNNVCTQWLDAPNKYEAGTPPIAQVIGFKAAIEYINKNINFDQLKKHEASLCSYLIDNINNKNGYKVIGSVDYLKNEGHLVTLYNSYAHPHDIAAYCDMFNICVRAGYHCAKPLHDRLSISGTLRISFYAYNTLEEVDLLILRLNEFINKIK